MFARNFSNAYQGGDNLKKRDYSETHLSRNPLRQPETPKNATQFYTFEDSSTVKPNDNTIIRNPTLMAKFGQQDRQQTQQLNRSHHVQPMNLSKLEFDHAATAKDDA